MATAASDSIEQQLLFPDVFTSDNISLAGELGDVLCPDFLREFLSDGDEFDASLAQDLKVSSTSDEVVSSFDRTGSPEVSSVCAPPAADAAASAPAAVPTPLSLLMAWPAGLVTTAMQPLQPLVPMNAIAAPTAAVDTAAAAMRPSRAAHPCTSCSSADTDSSERCGDTAANLTSTSSGHSAQQQGVSSPADNAEAQAAAATKLTRMQQAAAKRKAPEVDWRSITDPAERRKQRRLAKNRVTAARSRERKKAQWGEMEGVVNNLQAENAQLRADMAAMAQRSAAEAAQLRTAMDAMAQENARLQAALASLYRGAGAACGAAVMGGGPTQPAALECLAIMHLVRLLPCTAAERSVFLLLLCLVVAAAAAAAGASGGISFASAGVFGGLRSFGGVVSAAVGFASVTPAFGRTRRRQGLLAAPSASWHDAATALKPPRKLEGGGSTAALACFPGERAVEFVMPWRLMASSQPVAQAA